MVKFSQKLGFKGYPDLKFSVGEAIARGNGGDGGARGAGEQATIRTRRWPRACGAARRRPRKKRG